MLDVLFILATAALVAASLWYAERCDEL